MSTVGVILVLIVYALAAMRITRLINSDTILDRFRIAIAGRVRDPERSATEQRRWAALTEFLACPWCVGMWVALAGAVPVVLVLGWSWWALLPAALACSQIIGMSAPLYADDEIEYQSVTE